MHAHAAARWATPAPRAALHPEAAGAATSGDAFALAGTMFEMATGVSLPQRLRAQFAGLEGNGSAEARIQAQLEAAGLREAARALQAAGCSHYRFLAAQAVGLIGAHKARCMLTSPC